MEVADLADYLERETITPEQRESLIHQAEVAAIKDPILRDRITQSLIRHALDLRNFPSSYTLWSAIRRFASMVPIEQSDVLLEFMRPEDESKTIQAALEGVFSIYSVGPFRNTDVSNRLRKRVLELATIWINPAKVVSSGDAALALACYKASLALRADPEGAMFEGIQSLNRRVILNLATTARKVIADREARIMRPVLEGSMEPGTDLGEKRFYLPGITLKFTCPKCGHTYARDMGDNYLPYPRVGVPIVAHAHCPECEHEWDYQLKLNVSLEVL